MAASFKQRYVTFYIPSSKKYLVTHDRDKKNYDHNLTHFSKRFAITVLDVATRGRPECAARIKDGPPP